MAPELLLTVAAVLAGAAGVALLLGANSRDDSVRAAVMARLTEVFRQTGTELQSGSTILSRLSGFSLSGVLVSEAQSRELERLLRQADWDSGTRAGAFYLSLLALAAGGAIGGFVLGSFGGYPPIQHLAAVLAGALAGLVFPKRLLAAVAQRRRGRLAAEVPVMAHLLRMLVDAGLSYEAALRVVRKEARDLAPELCAELDRVMARVEIGLELADTLDDMARRLEVAELQDLVAMLCQLIELGGAARESLTRLIHNMESRGELGLRERVNKIAGKMSVVMMLFLFPALLVFVAGPGLIGISAALGG